MILRRAPARLVLLLAPLLALWWPAAAMAADTKPVPQAGAVVPGEPAESDLQDGGEQADDADGELPLPVLSPTIPYRPLNWYSRQELAAFPPGSAPAVTSWCNGAYVALPLPPLDGDEKGAGAPVYVTANEMQLDENGESQVVGGVEVRRGSTLMRADHAVITAGRDRLRLDGGVYLQDPAMTLEADSAELTLDGSDSRIVNARYALHEQHVRGAATEIHREQQWRISIDGGMYTTCEPGHDTWHLSARRIALDQEEGWGSAHDMWLHVQSVPVFYVPYLSFPIDKRRRTGVLYPTIKLSGSNGADIAVPYYFNLDPQYDLLLRPRWIEKRGALLEGELRYLHGSPDDSVGEGELGIGWIGKDALYNDEERHIVRFRHVGNPREEWQLLADATGISDDNYLDDLDTQLSVNRDSHLDRVLQTSWTADRWTALGRVQDFQTINPLIAPQDRPYRRLPQLALTGALPSGGVDGLTWLGYGEFTWFDRDPGAMPNPTGARVRAETMARWDAETRALRVSPALRVRHAAYTLDDNPVEAPSVTLPTASLDGTLFLERELVLNGRDWTQTLEPRVYALWTPHEDQDDIPVFDSSAITFGYDQLFRDNRFTGGDRIGDARQVSLAVESRLLSGNGTEAARIGVGQAFYLADRRVQLSPLTPPATDDLSPLVVDAAWRLSRDWSARGDGQWTTDDGEFVRGGLRVNWQDPELRTLNLAWRYEDPAIDQLELSGLLPVGDSWNFVGRWLRDVRNRRSLETLGGVEYESCCWRARVFARRTVDLDAATGMLASDDSVVFEIELKGLGSLGDKISTELANDIPGYETRQRTLR